VNHLVKHLIVQRLVECTGRTETVQQLNFTFISYFDWKLTAGMLEEDTVLEIFQSNYLNLSL
jgi:hypothetical protein